MINRLHTGILKLILGKFAGGLPRNAICSVLDVQHDPAIRASQTFLQIVHKADCFDCESDGIPSAEWMRLRYVMNEKLIVGVRNCLVFPRSGAVVNPDDKILLESMGSLYKALSYSGFTTESSRHRFSNRKSTENLIVPGVGGFYHWIFESLLGILRCSETHPEFKILLPHRRPTYVDESLSLIFGSGWKERIVFSSCPLQVCEAVFYSKSSGAQFVHPEDLRLLRDCLLPHGTCDSSQERIFISRQDAKARACDEKSLIESFSKRGYVIVQMEKMPLAEQIGLISQASHVAGYHGAGFSHGIFSKPDCSFIELFRYDALNDCYARILKTLGREYRFLVSDCPIPNSFKSLDQVLI